MKKLSFPLIGLIMVLVPAAPAEDNPWTEKVPAALHNAERYGTAEAYVKALDVTWRADAWQDGMKLADKALARYPRDVAIRGRAARAMWRGGRILEAEKTAAALPNNTRDHVALRTQIAIDLSRCELDAAQTLADRLSQLEPLDAEDLYAIFNVRFERGSLDGASAMLRKAEKATNPADGYPQSYMGEAFDGVAQFLDAVGTQPLNQVTKGGSAPMAPLPLLNLPAVDVRINGYGPFRMIVDTGGSIMVALDQTVADRIGLKSIAPASVHGVSGKQETGQVLLEKLEIGTISCRRVVTRTFDVRGSIMNAADGIIGPGVFTDSRLTLDFANAELRVGASSTAAGPGDETPVRIVGDAKFVVPVTIQDQPGAALFDTGADAIAMSPSRMKELFPDQELKEAPINAALGIGGDAMPTIGFGKGVDVTIGERNFPNFTGVSLDVIDTLLSPIIGVQCDLLVGMPAFRQMKTFTIDLGRGKMWIDWLENN